MVEVLWALFYISFGIGWAYFIIHFIRVIDTPDRESTEGED